MIIPRASFATRLHRPRRPAPDAQELADAAAALKEAKKPFVICGGGVLYSEAEKELLAFCEKRGIPIAETQAGKSATPPDHPLHVGAVGVTGTDAANRLAEEADVILAVGTRLNDFMTGSWALFKNPERRFIGLNTQSFDATKHRALPLVADAKVGLAALDGALGDWRAADLLGGGGGGRQRRSGSRSQRDYLKPTNADLPTDAQVLGALMRGGKSSDIVVCAAGGFPGDLHKLWQAQEPLGYHLEYGYSCMGYEIAGAIGVKLAQPKREVIVVVGDGSYLMMNSEIATAKLLGLKLIIVINDNRGFGCINRLQRATGGESFNNLLRDTLHEELPEVDFVAHARSLGAHAVKAASIAELETAMAAAREAKGVQAIVLDTDPINTTDAGGHWWDVAVPEVSSRPTVNAAREDYEEGAAFAARWRLTMTIRLGVNPIGWSNDDLQDIGGDIPLETCLAEAKEAGLRGHGEGPQAAQRGRRAEGEARRIRSRVRRRLVFDRVAAPLGARGIRERRRSISR